MAEQVTHDPMCQRYEADHWCETASSRTERRTTVTDHDPMCPCFPDCASDSCTKCRCEEYARVRADERRRELLAVCECGCRERDAHAEAVAARLVEVICEDNAARWRLFFYVQEEAGRLADQRDAARAEVDRLNIEIGKVVDSRERNRVEMGQKVIDAHRDAALARAALVGLRAKVEELRDESIWARRGTVAENGLDTVPSAWHNGRTSLADAVLALLEADRG